MSSRVAGRVALGLTLCIASCSGGGGGGGDPPAIPAALVATVNGTDVDLAWTASTGATSYNIYYDIEPGVTRTAATRLGSVSTAGATVIGQSSLIAYFAVAAVGPEGESGLSNEVTASIPSSAVDALFGDQWHLVNTGQAGGSPGQDVNIASSWVGGFNGTGARIAIVDDGLEIGHEDLFWNVLPGQSHDYVTGSSDPTGGAHGTSCAGVAASVGGNGFGGRGAAFEAHLVGYNFLAVQTLSSEANSMTRDAAANWISSNSWGPTDGTPISSSSTWKQAIATGLAQGRAAKGLIYLFAAGNGASAGPDPGDNSNLDGYANHYGVIAVGAVGDDGVKASYSENGANVLLCAPSRGRANHAITTVDRTGAAGYNDGSSVFDYADDAYTNTFNGTSSSTPLAAGVVALVLQANPSLSWRDLRLVLAQSARMNDPLDLDWATNGAGYAINHKYGFGVIDAAAALALAQAWVNVGPMTTFTTPTDQPNLAIPDASVVGVASSIVVTGSGIASIEHVEIRFDADDHPYSGDLEIVLTSPSATGSVLTEAHVIPSGVTPTRFDNFRFGSVRHLDEPADGTWTLTVRDLGTGDTGTFKSWTLVFRGR